MKKSLITTTAAVATVMSASAAYADLSLGGAMTLKYVSGDSTTGWQGTATSYTVNVDYTTTLDNGMGYAVNVDIAGPSASVLQLHTFSTDMGSVFLGTDFTSAVDSKDYVQGAGPFANNPASTTTYNGLLLNGFNDGDALTDNGIGMSTSVAGADVMVTYGDDMTGNGNPLSIAASMNIAGATIKAGNTDFDDSARDDNGFMSVGYSVGGFSLGYNYYDMTSTSITQIGASTTVGGLGVGVSSGTKDNGASADHDAMGIHISGDLGGAFWQIDYMNTDFGNGTESDDYVFYIGTGF